MKGETIAKIVTPLIISLVIALITWAAYSENNSSNAWKKEINDRISIEVQNSEINFNMTKPTDNEYKFCTTGITCGCEKDWQEMNNTLHRFFDFMKSSDKPNGSVVHMFQKLSYVYIGYTLDSPIGQLFIGYDIYITYEDC